MLYDSTKALLRSILDGLEASEEIEWDGHSESGKACLYEMHQMSRPLYQAYRADGTKPASGTRGGISEKLARAMPHVKSMVTAIRLKDRVKAIESGRAALVEMNDVIPRRLADDVQEKISSPIRNSQLGPARFRGRVRPMAKSQ